MSRDSDLLRVRKYTWINTDNMLSIGKASNGRWVIIMPGALTEIVDTKYEDEVVRYLTRKGYSVD